MVDGYHKIDLFCKIYWDLILTSNQNIHIYIAIQSTCMLVYNRGNRTKLGVREGDIFVLGIFGKKKNMTLLDFSRGKEG